MSVSSSDATPYIVLINPVKCPADLVFFLTGNREPYVYNILDEELQLDRVHDISSQ
jgi:hypothetical protein